jgi:hypothetical protein
LDQRQKRQRLERYLKQEKAKGKDRGQRSLTHLMAKLAMTEEQLRTVASKSGNIDYKVTINEESGRADALLLEWNEQ